jgi:hypothetical protein
MRRHLRHQPSIALAAILDLFWGKEIKLWRWRRMALSQSFAPAGETVRLVIDE